MSRILDYEKDYNLEPFKVWLGPYFGVVIVKPEDLQVITFLKTIQIYWGFVLKNRDIFESYVLLHFSFNIIVITWITIIITKFDIGNYIDLY